MSIWGKIIGAGAGFALGGPIGAMVGGLAGHAVDMMRESAGPEGAKAESDDATKNIAFTVGVIVLGAKLAKVDGKVTRDEVSAFKEVFHVPPEEMKNVGRVFNQARKDARGFEPYAKQLGRMFEGNLGVLEELLDGLFHIARADGHVTEPELEFLEQVAACFGFDEAEWARIRASNMGPDSRDPFQVLGVDHQASEDQIKSAYRRLVRENHPDRLVAQGMPQEFIEIANEKLATINEAYERIQKMRGFS